MKPFANEASSWVFSSANSCGAILYGRLEIGDVPGISLPMILPIYRGGMPAGPQGKTFGKSRTTGISSRSGSGSTFKVSIWILEMGDVYSIVWPEGWVSLTDFAL